jgi:hypothetical protein
VGGHARRDADQVVGSAGRYRRVTIVARIKDDLRAWQRGRCVFVGNSERRRVYVLCLNPENAERSLLRER